jgi:hypothetical protein
MSLETATIPPRRGGRPLKYPFRFMAVGESVFIPGATQRLLNKSRRTYFPMKFRMKDVVRGGITGTRVWRIA